MTVSPCNQKCKLIAGRCISCLRSKQDLTEWSQYTDDQRHEIMAKIELRYNIHIPMHEIGKRLRDNPTY